MSQRPLVEANHLEVEHHDGTVEDTHHHAFAKHCRQHGDPQVDRVPADRQTDAAVLGEPPLGDVEIRHHLHARGDGESQMPRWGNHLVQDPVTPNPNLELVLERLKMQVARVILDGQQEDHVEKLADRRAIGQRFHAGQVQRALPTLQRLGRFGQLHVGLHVGDEALDAFRPRRVVPLQRVDDVGFGRHHGPDIVAQKAPQFVDDRQLLRIAHGDRQRVVLEADRNNPVKLGHRLRHVRQDVRGNNDLAEFDHLQTHLLGQRLGHLLVVQ